MSYVSIRVCGRFFEVWGRPFPTSGKSAVVLDGEIISAGLVSDNFRKGDAFSELPANAPRSFIPGCVPPAPLSPRRRSIAAGRSFLRREILP